MNCKPEKSPRFAVNRAAMVSRLPGVKLSSSAKRFARGRPKLVPTGLLPGYDEASAPLIAERMPTSRPAGFGRGRRLD